MKTYVVALAAGVLVGIIYAAMRVRSPAPPLVALFGLLGILIGEQVVPIARRVFRGEQVTASWFMAECVPQITGVPADPVPPPSSPSATTPPSTTP